MEERQLCKLDVESSNLFISTNEETIKLCRKGEPLQLLVSTLGAGYALVWRDAAA